MIDFQRLQLSQREAYERIFFSCPPRGCEYAFANLFLWGRQQIAFRHGCAAFFSHFNGRSVYPYPIGDGDRKAVIAEIVQDSQQRGIPCRITNVLAEDRAELEAWFPGRFAFRTDRDGFDYVYAIDDLADLKGRKFQKKRNHFHRFCTEHPNYEIQPIDAGNTPAAQHMVDGWYRQRMREDPHGNYMLESIAMEKAFQNFRGLNLEGILLMDASEVLAVTVGSRLAKNTFDVHFEKAREDAEGAYAAINCEFARYIRQKYPDVHFLDREDDMGVEGLRKAKLSYHPHHMIEKDWAFFMEDIHAD